MEKGKLAEKRSEGLCIIDPYFTGFALIENSNEIFYMKTAVLFHLFMSTFEGRLGIKW